MKVLVCGGRDFLDRERVYAVLDRIHGTDGEITTLIHGDARGADMLAKDWAHAQEIRPGIGIMGFPADWKNRGRSAGPIRNQQMIELKPDLVVAFPGGRGTADMVGRANKAGVKVIEG